MNFEFARLKFDMETTPFEDMFLNSYIPLLSEYALKVYLLLYKNAYRNESVNEQFIINQLLINKDIFDKAIEELVGYKLVEKDEILDKLIIQSLRQNYLNGLSNKKDKETDESVRATQRKNVIETIEKIIQRYLTINEINNLNEAFDQYNLDLSLYVEAFKESKAKTGNVNPNYVLGFIRNWNDQGIVSLKDLKEKQRNVKTARKKSTSRKSKIDTPDVNESSITEMIRRQRLERIKKMRQKEGDKN